MSVTTPDERKGNVRTYVCIDSISGIIKLDFETLPEFIASFCGEWLVFSCAVSSLQLSSSSVSSSELHNYKFCYVLLQP